MGSHLTGTSLMVWWSSGLANLLEASFNMSSEIFLKNEHSERIQSRATRDPWHPHRFSGHLPIESWGAWPPVRGISVHDQLMWHTVVSCYHVDNGGNDSHHLQQWREDAHSMPAVPSSQTVAFVSAQTHFQMITSGVKEMAHWVKCLLPKHEDVSWDFPEPV